MPVFLLFDAADMLTRENVRFSEGNLAAGSTVGNTADFFESIPFRQVYHDSWLSEDEKRTIIFHRHAEVVVPDEIDLGALKWVVCRSEAEYQTLRCCVPARLWKRYEPVVVFGGRGNLFFRRWTFIESVNLEYNRVTFNFNQNTTSPGPFAASLTILDVPRKQQYVWEQSIFHAGNAFAIQVPQFAKPTPYEVTFMLDAHIAYRGRYSRPRETF